MLDRLRNNVRPRDETKSHIKAESNTIEEVTTILCMTNSNLKLAQVFSSGDVYPMMFN